MLSKTIEFALRKAGLVFFLTIVIIVVGLMNYLEMPVDAFPDISPVMVPIFAEAHGMAPEEVERLITWPIESAMNGLPGVEHTKSTSAFGMAVIYVYFSDGTDIFFARQIVSERLARAVSELPKMDEPPKLGPISTGLGQVFIYYLTADPEKVNTEGKPLPTWLRELNDWVIKYQLQTVKGVTAVLSMGGQVLQYQIKIDPRLLQKYQLSISDVVDAVNNNNRNAGGQFLTTGSEEYLVRGIGLLDSIESIRNIPVKTHKGTPVLIKDVAEVGFGEEIRRGAVTRNGEEEVVSGIVMKLYGENTSKVIKRLHKRLAQVQNSLPDGVKIVPYYDQAELVDKATDTVLWALLQGAALIGIVLIIFLGNLRTAFIVMLSLPLCALIAAIFINKAGISANLMSLGGIAIAIGMLCDGSIVMMESILNKLDHTSGRKKFYLIKSAAQEVSRPILFSGMIVIAVFLPLLTLEGVEGKMFSPMAFSISAAMVGSIIVALIIVPALALFLLKHEKLEETALVKRLKKIYKPLLEKSLKARKKVISAAVIMFFLSLSMAFHTGTEFVPVLEEGSILIGLNMAPSISLEKAIQQVMSMESEIIKFPEVRETVSRVGRPEAGTHPHPVNYGEIQIELKPQKLWKSGRTKLQLIEALNQKLKNFPGVQLNFTQPIQNAFDELISGVKTQLAIKVFGEDLKIIQKKAEEIKNTIDNIPGLVDLSLEQSFGQPQVQIIADREKCARYGISVAQVLELVELAIGGETIDNMFLNTRRFGIHVRYREEFRNDPDAIRNMLIPTSDGTLIPLGQIAEVKTLIGPLQINRENNQRRWTVQGNIRGRDLGSVISDIQKRIAQKVTLPPGYRVEYGGQFENQQRAMLKLSLIVPAIILVVLVMLWLSFSSLKHALIIFTMVPLSIVGGVFGLHIMREYLSVPASIGFIALFGMAMLDGMVMVSCFNELHKRGMDLNEIVIEGSLTRLAPVLVTTITTLLGLLPLMLSSGIGSEVQRPLASVVVFGLFTSTFLTLFVIPAVYSLVEEKTRKE
ncbi:MAG: CusA/CzcA family heavy metal efflux RND transporter [Candidatus Rifleibacteriota bacterium]